MFFYGVMIVGNNNYTVTQRPHPVKDKILPLSVVCSAKGFWRANVLCLKRLAPQEFKLPSSLTTCTISVYIHKTGAVNLFPLVRRNNNSITHNT